MSKHLAARRSGKASRLLAGFAVVAIAAFGSVVGASPAMAATPMVSSVTPNSGAATGGNTVTINGADLSGIFNVKFGSKNATSYKVVNPTTVTAVVPSGVPSSTVPIVVTGSQGQSSGDVTYHYDSPNPVISSISPASGSIRGGNSITLTGTEFTEASAVLFDGVPVSFYPVSDTSITVVVPETSKPGQVSVVVVGSAGNSNSLPYTYYVPAFTVSNVSPDAGSVVGGTEVTITGSNFTPNVEVFFGSQQASVVGVTESEIRVITPSNVEGASAVTVSNTVQIIRLDSAFTYVAEPQKSAPVITSFTKSGPAAGGNQVTIFGSGFTSVSRVLFGTRDVVAFAVLSDNEILTEAPEGMGEVPLSVVSPDGEGVSAAPYTYVNAPVAPVIKTISPNKGAPAGGTVITIIGSGFTDAVGVLFGGSKFGTEFTVVSDTEIRVVSPAGEGVVDVMVTSPDFDTVENGGFTYVEPVIPGDGGGTDNGGTTPGTDDGGTTPGTDDGGTTPGTDDGGTTPGTDNGGTSPVDNGGVVPGTDNGGTDETPTVDQPVVTDGDGNTATPTDADTSENTVKRLAQTGAEIGGWLSLAALLLFSGIAFVLSRRERA